jgi:hypothetical protein
MARRLRLRLVPGVLGRTRRPRRIRGRLAALRWAARRRIRGWRPAWVSSVPGVLAVLFVAALAGLAVRAGGEGDHRARQRAGSAPPQVIARGVLRVPVPPGWSSTDRAPRLPGMTLSDPVVLVNRRSGVQVVVDALPATSQTLLPAAFVKGMQTDLPRPSTVPIGQRLRAYHYAGLVHPEVARLLDMYVAPTTAGTVTVACLAQAVASLLDDCWSVVSRLSIAKGRPLAPGRAAAFREVLADRVAVLDAEDATARRRLDDATTPAEQARAVADLPAAYRGAAAAGAAIAPSPPAWPRMIVEGLQQTGAAYEAFERSLRRADRDAYAEAKQQLRARRTRLKRLLDRFSMSPARRASR